MKADKAAAIGAGVGAVVTYLANKDKDAEKQNERILKAAAGGGDVGYYMATQETKLRNKLQGSGVSVERNGDNINFTMPGNMTD